MSRSIHTTRKTFSQLATKKFASAKERVEVMDKAKGELRRKRRIKRQVGDERRRAVPPLAGTDSSTIPIQVHNIGQYVHHNASVEDVRAVLALLPPAATEGISSIKLILGKEYIDEEYADEYEDRDPFTGRLSHETLPGIYSGVCLGTYATRSGQIKLHAHVYDAAKLPLARNVCELYLKLRALMTFVHEVAHHHDEVNRVRRGRWLADRKENVECYAEKMEHEWTRQFVLPYLEKRHPTDVKDLLDFVEHRGGLRVALEFFAGDSRSTLRNGFIRLAFTTDGAFDAWVRELPKCADLAASCLAFAWELHYADHYEACLQVLERVLVEKPALSSALTCKGDTLIHLERYDEAFDIAERVLAAEPANDNAWEIRGDVFERRDNWNALLENCIAWERSGRLSKRAQNELLTHRAVAYCALDNNSAMEASITAYLALLDSKNSEVAARRRKHIHIRVFRRAGKPVPPEFSSK